jgi:5'-deoxynucleotidase YfbR-like HD superfamily hydrolase
LSDRGALYTYSGKIAFPEGSPTIFDIAIALSREGRFAGAGQRFFSVALHTFVVCDLLPTSLQLDGLLHDSPETITGDCPKPAKTDTIEAFEEELLRGIYASQSITFPDPRVRALVKEADRKVMRGEVYTVGNLALQEFYPPCGEAEELIFKYVKEYTYADMLESSGRVPMEFQRRFRLYRSQLDPKRFIS